jgi:molybdate transport system substrate-binding protein
MNRSWPFCKIPAAAGAILLFAAFLSRPALAQQQQIRIAAAADLQFAMPELAGQFEKQSGATVIVSYGSSGNFFSQIQNGAPFDLFFSADISYPRKLETADLCEPGTLFPYAFGRIVIWMPSGSPDDVLISGWKALLDPSVRKIAVANPAHAPYGRAAVAALRSAGIYGQVKDKLVYGENISQAAQFAQSGSAQAGILAFSLVLSTAMRGGRYWVIPQNLYPPLEQGMVILKSSRNKELARSFMQFVRSPAGRATLESFGFQTPVPTSPEAKN